jgi:high affinity sulfate transporter 1
LSQEGVKGGPGDEASQTKEGERKPDLTDQLIGAKDGSVRMAKTVVKDATLIKDVVQVTARQVGHDVSMGGRKKRNRPQDFLPILEWGPKYDKKFLKTDAIVGITIACLIIPDTMAVASIAGVPPAHGLYAGLFAALLYALTGSAKHVIGETPSALSAMAAATAVSIAVVGTEDYNQLIFMIAFLAGISCLAAGVLRLGFISNFISKPILKGFLFGIGLTIVASNLPKVLGIPKGEGNFFQQIYYIIQNLDQTNYAALGLALASLAIIILVEKKAKRIPGLLVALVFGIVTTWVMVSFFDVDISYVGAIPSGLPMPGIPEVSSTAMASIIPAAIGVGFIGYMQTLAIGKSSGERKGYEVDKDQEFIAVGSTNFIGGLFSGIPSGGSTSVSAVNEDAGAQSQVSSLVAAGILLLTLLFLTPLFYYLPLCVLGVIILLAVRSVLDVKEQARFFHINPTDFFLSIIAIFGVIMLNILAGLVIAVIISIVILMLRSSKPEVVILGRLEGRRGWYSKQRNPDVIVEKGLLILRPEGSLYFVNIDMVLDEIRYLLTWNLDAKVVLLDLSLTSSMDVTASDGLKRLIVEVQRKGLQLWFVGVLGPVKTVFDNSGISELIGDNDYQSIGEAVEKFKKL